VSRSVTGGRWLSQFKEWSDTLVDHVEKKSEGPLYEVGEYFKNYLTRIVLSGSFKGPPLAASTVERKGHSQPLIDTGEYVASFAVEVRKKLGRKQIVIQVAPDNARMAMLAQIHEYGTSTIPARPHWRPALAGIRNTYAVAKLLKGAWLDFK